MVRLAEFEHHVVRDVDHAVDRAHAKRRQALLHPQRRCADLNAVDRAGQEAAAQRGVDDFDLGFVGDETRAWCVGVLGEREGHTERGCEIAGDAGDRHGVRTVGVDLEVPENVALHTERFGDRRAEGSGAGVDRVGEQHDAVVVFAHAHLGSGAAHAVGHLASQLALGDLHAVGHDGADCGERDQVADRHVECAAADLQRFAVAHVDVDELDLVGVGVGSQIEHLGQDDALEANACDRHVFDRKAERAHLFAQLDGVTVDVGGEFSKPGKEDLHVTYLRTASGSGRRC